MALLVEGTDVEVGRWYPADVPPPKLSDEVDGGYELLLGIKWVGVRSGFYIHEEGQYYWHCERYDSFDDEPVPGWTREQEINNNLDWVYEKARGVVGWLMVLAFDETWDSIDGTTGFSEDPDQDWTVEERDDEDEDEEFPLPHHISEGSPRDILPIHDN